VYVSEFVYACLFACKRVYACMHWIGMWYVCVCACVCPCVCVSKYSKVEGVSYYVNWLCWIIFGFQKGIHSGRLRNPFVNLKLTGGSKATQASNEQKSTLKSNTIDPEWIETFAFLVEDINKSTLELEVVTVVYSGIMSILSKTTLKSE